jgi:NADH:flavin oxidoreductase / NADH oxidase family
MRAADVALREVTAEASPRRFSMMAFKIVIHGNYSAASSCTGVRIATLVDTSAWQRSVGSSPRLSLRKVWRLLAANCRQPNQPRASKKQKHFSGAPDMTLPDEEPLFTPYALGELQLRNRVAMASMTRGRARNAELAPTELHVEYYRQRATAGLILTEGTWISPRDRIHQRPRPFRNAKSRAGAASPLRCIPRAAQSSRSLPIPGRSRIPTFSMASCRPPRPR